MSGIIDGMDANADQYQVIDVPERSRYELHVDGTMLAHADYRLTGELLVIPYVETNPAHRGHGHGARLMDGVITDAERRGLRIRATCSYAASELRAHPRRAAVAER